MNTDGTEALLQGVEYKGGMRQEILGTTAAPLLAPAPCMSPDSGTVSACCYQIAVIGEAVKRLCEATRGSGRFGLT